jgi:hypothetical protein
MNIISIPQEKRVVGEKMLFDCIEIDLDEVESITRTIDADSFQPLLLIKSKGESEPIKAKMEILMDYYAFEGEDVHKQLGEALIEINDRRSNGAYSRRLDESWTKSIECMIVDGIDTTIFENFYLATAPVGFIDNDETKPMYTIRTRQVMGDVDIFEPDDQVIVDTFVNSLNRSLREMKEKEPEKTTFCFLSLEVFKSLTIDMTEPNYQCKIRFDLV